MSSYINKHLQFFITRNKLLNYIWYDIWYMTTIQCNAIRRDAIKCVMKCNATQRNATLRNAQHNTTQHNTIQYNTIQYNTIQYNANDVIQSYRKSRILFLFLIALTLIIVYMNGRVRFEKCYRCLKVYENGVISPYNKALPRIFDITDINGNKMKYLQWDLTHSYAAYLNKSKSILLTKRQRYADDGSLDHIIL